MALGKIAPRIGMVLLLLSGVALTLAGGLGLPRHWLNASGWAVAPIDGSDWAGRLEELEARESTLQRREAELDQRDAAMQAREMALARRDHELQQRESELVRSLHDLVEAPRLRGFQQVAGNLEKLPPPRVADRLAALDPVSAARIFLLLSEDHAAAVLGAMTPDKAAAMITEISKAGAST